MTFTLKEVLAIITFILPLGGAFALLTVHGKNITALWNQKQDKNVCVTAHSHIEEDIQEIKKDVKKLLTLNGGGP